jgi:hypothetical protein
MQNQRRWSASALLKQLSEDEEARRRDRGRVLTHPGTTFGGELVAGELPHYLYRGENCATYKTTSSAYHRYAMCSDWTPEEARVTMLLSGHVAARFGEDWARTSGHQRSDASDMLGWGFAEHYGCVTQFIDLSSSMEVAMTFALNRSSRWNCCRLLRLDVDGFLQLRRGRYSLADLTGVGYLRPRLQRAYALRLAGSADQPRADDPWLDLKSENYEDVVTSFEVIPDNEAILEADRIMSLWSPISDRYLCVPWLLLLQGSIRSRQTMNGADRLPARYFDHLTDNNPPEQLRPLWPYPDAADCEFDRAILRNLACGV